MLEAYCTYYSEIIPLPSLDHVYSTAEKVEGDYFWEDTVIILYQLKQQFMH